LGAAAAALSEVLTGAYDKAVGLGAEQRQGDEEGLEPTLALLFWRCLSPSNASQDFPPFLALAQAVALRIPYSRLAAGSSGERDAAAFLRTSLVPRIRAMAASSSSSSSTPNVSPALRPLVGLATAVALGLGPGPHWQALVDAAAAGGLAVLLPALEVVAEVRGRYETIVVGGTASLPSLADLLSEALAPHALAALDEEGAVEPAPQRARFLALCLGAWAGARRRVGAAAALLLSSSAVAGLVERALALRSPVGVEALLAALDGGQEGDGSKTSSVLGSHASALLALAFQLLGPGVDARVGSVLRRMQESRAPFRAAVVASLAVSLGLMICTQEYADAVLTNKQSSTLQQTPLKEHAALPPLGGWAEWAAALLRLVRLLAACSGSPEAELLPGLLVDVGAY
jgi:hypothetical protein